MDKKVEKKTNRIKPTIKQKQALINILQNGGNISKAMRDAGYSPVTAKNPKKLTESEGFLILLAESGASDEELATILASKLYAKKVVGYLNSKVKGVEKVSDEFVEVDDNPTIMRAVELLLKVKGYMRDGGKQASSISFTNITILQKNEYGRLDDEILNDRITEALSR